MPLVCSDSKGIQTLKNGKRSLRQGWFFHVETPKVISYTARNVQVAASLLQACYLAVIKPISGCVRIACSGLMITSLLQVVNRLDASCLSRLFIHKLDASCFNNLQQVCKYKRATNQIFTDLLQFDEVNRLAATC